MADNSTDLNDLSDYKELYYTTAFDYLMHAGQAINVLATNTLDPDAIESFFIAVHSLKSQSLIMGHTQTGILSGTLEHIIRKVRQGTLVLTPAIVEDLTTALKALAASVDSIKDHEQELDLSATIAHLEQTYGVKFTPV